MHLTQSSAVSADPGGPVQGGGSVPALEMQGVDVAGAGGAGSPVVLGVDWTVMPGEFWVVGGLLRSGKTDFALTAAGAQPPARGTVRVFGHAFRDGFAEEEINERLRVGLVHDGGLLLRHLTVAENIALPMRYHHDAAEEDVAERVRGWLEAMDLGPQANIRSSAVSRNWAQRAGLARACILTPDLLVLDNPLTGLDPQHAHWWLTTLSALAAGHRLLAHRRLTLVVTCDDFRPWIAPGRRFAVLRNSRLDVLPAHLEPGQVVGSLLEGVP